VSDNIDRIKPATIAAFRRRILNHYRRHGRDLPFRRTRDPYKITLAEIMLQQTQVERVVPKYESWIARWPTWQALAEASTRELLAAWSGLGYNRRALFLGKMADVIVEQFDGRLPEEPAALKRLPGIGHYTANAIAIFAFNQPLITIDTNIRRVFLLEFDLPDETSRAEIEKLAWRALPKQRSREWHNALMDYSRLALRTPERKVKPLTRQGRLEGSRRQIRGEIIRRLTRQQRVSLAVIARDLDRSIDDVRSAAESLAAEGMVIASARTVRLNPD